MEIVECRKACCFHNSDNNLNKDLVGIIGHKRDVPSTKKSFLISAFACVISVHYSPPKKCKNFFDLDTHGHATKKQNNHDAFIFLVKVCLIWVYILCKYHVASDFTQLYLQIE